MSSQQIKLLLASWAERTSSSFSSSAYFLDDRRFLELSHRGREINPQVVVVWRMLFELEETINKWPFGFAGRLLLLLLLLLSLLEAAAAVVLEFEFKLLAWLKWRAKRKRKWLKPILSQRLFAKKYSCNCKQTTDNNDCYSPAYLCQPWTWPISLLLQLQLRL